ncbi:MAG: hypothetical protein ACR2O3_12115 [Rhizobiaceae bacterium]
MSRCLPVIYVHVISVPLRYPLGLRCLNEPGINAYGDFGNFSVSSIRARPALSVSVQSVAVIHLPEGIFPNLAVSVH